MNTEERLSRIENVMETLSTHVIHLDDVMTALAEAQITLTRRMESITLDFAERDRLLGERIESIARESVERDRRLGERIETLVRAIGEFIRNRPAAG